MKLRKIMNNMYAVDLNNEHTVTFSYETPIGFTDGHTMTVRENEWGPTTGKHLNYLEPDKSKRLVSGEFLARLRKIGL